ncbi:fungal-specific transcription factor domain-containing protein [Morchella snyderi]|nr:fungal-specific transcription factor domain-containing protein [Morchella snyderi]
MSEQPEIQFQPRRRASTNRQRPKVRDEDRKRIAVACDHCKTRKIRCTGEQPCRQCYLANITCNYPPASAKIVVPELFVDKLQARISALERALYDAVPDQAVREDIAGRFGINFLSQNGSMTSSSGEPSPTSPGAAVWPENGSFSFKSRAIAGEDLEAGDELNRFSSCSEGYSSFIGDSAGATFIDKIRDFIRSSYPHIPRNISYIPSHSVPVDPALSFTSAASSYYTHDSLPLSLPVTDPYTLPQKTTVLRHLDSFLKLCACGTSAQPVDGGGIFHWFNPSKIYLEIEALYEVTNYGPPLNSAVSPVDYTSLCVINMILALSCQVMATTGTSSTVEDELAGIPAHWRHFVPGSEPISPHTHIDQTYHHTRENSASNYAHNSANTLPGMTFFARAKLLLVNPVEEASLPSLRIITLMSYYLLSANRRDAAYMYIGLAVRMAVSHGLHRTWRKGEWVSGGIGRYNGPGLQFSSASSPEDQLRKLVQYEEKKREFWNIYILDRVFSCYMGRPVMLSDEDIDVDLPLEIGDALPSGAGLSAHVRLSKIMGDVVNKVYRVRKTTSGFGRDIGDVVGVIENIHKDLRSWEESLPPELKLINGVARGRSVLLLHFLYNQLHILTTRPSLLLAAKQRTAAFCVSSGNIPQMPPHIEQHVMICSNAARRNIALGRQLQSSGWISHHSFTDYHYLFNAAIVLLLSRVFGQEMQECTCATGACSTPSNDDEDIHFVITLLSGFGERGNEAAAASAKTASELSVIVERMICARDSTPPAPVSPQTPYPASHEISNIAINGQFEVPSYFPNHYSVAGNPPGPSIGYSTKQLYHQNLEVEDVYAWLQSGHFDR